MLERMYLRYCERKGFQRRSSRGISGRSRRHQERDAQGDRRVRLRAPAHRDRRAPARAQVAVRRQQPPPHVLRERVRLSRSRRDDRGRRSIPPTCASTPIARPAPAASTSTRPTRRSASRTCRPTSSCSARTTARSTATAPKRWRCCKSKLYELELRKRNEEKQALEDSEDRHRLGPPDPLVRARPVAHQGPAHRTSRSATRRRCSTATSTISSRRA